MTNTTCLTAAHVRYLLAIKRLYTEKGLYSSEIAKELGVTKPTVHNMMDVFLERNYIYKKPQGPVYLTKYGMRVADEYELYYHKIRDVLFSDRKIDHTAETAICALLGELSEENLGILAQEIELSAAM